MLQCVCCKCGALDCNANSTLCLAFAGAHQDHCFCCAQPPRMKCIHCNMWRELSPMEAHGPCVGGSLHVFVYSEIWPPFPENTPLSPLRAMPSTDGDTEHMYRAPDSPAQSKESLNDIEREPYAVAEDNVNINSPVSIIDLADDDQEGQQEADTMSDVDIKPKLAVKCDWVNITDILKWTNCTRCGLVRIQKRGWLRHVQSCAQDPKYRSNKLFIHLHTKAWCGMLVRDIYWDKHTHPENGTCDMCRLSRMNNVPLPYQPKPPPRKNETTLERSRRSRMIISRRKRRQTIALDTFIHNAGGTDSMQIVDCSSLRQI
ncbi:uncharacterized protein LOC115762744 [Drosophila novamexicana]|uniref:uncharacterized protein LOC115762744 n=1 Tax=Drosophila novamexicana TaxID=47314 RepID=UPI0011E6000E|nr:uncharacterized protein LOC115762744 [Drosophila novamexicana]XP_030560941.1 uncharacterized protein LOC115762744 [Drosophila novamexicana]